MKALLVVCTDPSSAELADEYNCWYSDEHVPDVLAVPGYVRAARYRALDGEHAIAQRYLCLYELEVADEAELQAVSDEHMRRIAHNEMRRSPGTVMARESMRAQYYTSIGARVGDEVWPPAGVFLVFTDPASPDVADEYNRWYQHTHLPEVVDVPGFVAAARYRVAQVTMLDAPWVVTQRHLAVYELASGDPADIAATMVELRRRVAEHDRMEMTPTMGRPTVAQTYILVS